MVANTNVNTGLLLLFSLELLLLSSAQVLFKGDDLVTRQRWRNVGSVDWQVIKAGLAEGIGVTAAAHSSVDRLGVMSSAQSSKDQLVLFQRRVKMRAVRAGCHLATDSEILFAHAQVGCTPPSTTWISLCGNTEGCQRGLRHSLCSISCHCWAKVPWSHLYHLIDQLQHEITAS